MNHENKYVSWMVFTWVVALFTGVIGFLILTDIKLSNRLDSYSPQFTQIQTQLSQIQTDLVWVKKALVDHEANK